jgi:exonuclease SbcD
MSQRAFRFIHASDLHLERPPSGLADIPEHLRQTLLEAPYLAAERVFEIALSEQVDFVALSGDIVHLETAGPRALMFLAEQFQRLAERDIQVYWSGGNVDPPESWPAALHLPSNVHRFGSARPEDRIHHRDGIPLARVTGLSRRQRSKIRVTDFWPDPAGLTTVAVVYGSVDRAGLAERPIHYWALGGSHRRGTVLGASQVAHYPGTNQGRTPDEAGLNGCTLVRVDGDGRIQPQLVPCDVLRWQQERVEVEPTTTRERLEQALRGRMQDLIAANPGLDLLVDWTVTGTGLLLASLRRGTLPSELLASLRQEFGRTATPAWSVTLEAEPDALPDAWYEQQTILGDFLREARGHEPEDAENLNLEVFLSQRHAAGDLAAAVQLHGDQPQRQRVLRRAAALGAELLGGEGRDS